MDIFGICSTLCFLIGTPLNTVSFYYFNSRKSSNKCITLIYSLISVTDAVICALSLCPTVSYLLSGRPGIFGVGLLCTLWDVVMEVSVRYSLFLVAVLSVCRTRALLLPLRLFGLRNVTWIATGYFLALVLQESLPTVVLRQFATYFPSRLSCHFFALETVFTPLQTIVFKMITFFGEIGIPMAVGGLTGGLCIHILMVKADKYDNNVTEVQKRRKREATKTIIMVTGLCVLLNLPIVSIAVAFTLKVKMSMRAILVGVDVASSLVVLNSLFNSFVYFVRIKRMRTFAKRSIVDKIFRTACNRTTSNDVENYVTP